MRTFVACLSALALLVALPVLLCHRPAVAQPSPALAALELTGPYVYRNLAVFAVHDRAATHHEDILTLQEGLAKRVVTIQETGQVNQLVASNKGDKSVYLQAGDIVKGGQQDRVLQHDTVLPPNAKQVRLSVFCVESGRWHGRGTESAQQFSASDKTIMTKRQKLAVKVSGKQGDVWESVAAAQADMGKNVGHSVQAPASATSLQLSLEDKKLDGAVAEYVQNIEKQVPKDDTIVGYAVAVNGNVDSVEVFASPALFGKLKGKLLKASASEAVASKQAKDAAPPKVDAVRALIADAESGAARQEKQTLRTQVTRKETSKNVLFETNDPLVPTKAMRKSYLSK